MCTVSLVPTPDGMRLICNRDERLDRAEALMPRITARGQMARMFPVDPASCGTWVGVNEAGLAAALLNRQMRANSGSGHTGTAESRALTSRGVIVPRLLECESIAEALAAASGLGGASFLPFTVVLAQRGRTAVIESATLDRCRSSRLIAPVMFTSSSLGDDLVDAPRRRLFGEVVLANRDEWMSGQVRFHHHQWAAAPEVSVLMARADARTVSRTCVHISGRYADLQYEPLPATPLDAERAA